MKFLFKLPVIRLLNRVIVQKPFIHHRTLAVTSQYRAWKLTDLSFLDDGTPEDIGLKSNVSGLIERAFQNLTSGQQVLVIQPYIKWGPLKKRNTTPELQLEESVSLINTLNDWKVVGKEIVGLNGFESQYFFGKGKLSEIKATVQQNQYITCVFVSVEMLNRAQHEFLEQFFSVPVYDRYLIVMQIFREHAVSKEAKIQIALAELPYMYSRMKYTEDSSLGRIGDSAKRISGTTIFTTPDTRKLILHKYESKLKNELEKVRKHREMSRSSRQMNQHPVVAVVGYTNSGKTSIIKALTGQHKLTPKDCLFATLDVTFHVGLLPCNMKVFYVDTVGFISDIPTHLIEPFSVTLRDAMQADVILHVQDISHPDWKKQHDQVFETLEQLKIEKKLLGHVITVGNKVDRLTDEENQLIPSDALKTSCLNFQGIDDLKLRLQDEIIKATGRSHMVIRARTGSEEDSWLRSEATVADAAPDPKNMNYSLLSVLITESTLDKFKRTFIYSKSKK
ncbi:putative GTP-binding protein 6 [Planococcus citri]|uniref:putative GTP-binding protein 6 n=1 Tax=Planococcus citri TaxID=170843 RepID=UPI0031F826FA